MQSSTAEEKPAAEFNPSSTELSSDKLAGTDLEDNTGFLKCVTVLLSRYGIETHG